MTHLNKTSGLLPIAEYKDKLKYLIHNNQVSIISAETGSGKSTQLANYLQEKFKYGVIAYVQPRKLAAISLAKFVSNQSGSLVGNLIGYDVGNEKHFTRSTKILYMTVNSLLAEWKRDNHLKKYSCVILDEAHERTVSFDLLLGLLKNILREKNSFRIIITSASIEAEEFKNFFGEFSVGTLNIPGKIFPIEIRYDLQKLSLTNYLSKGLERVKQILNNRNDNDNTILMFLCTLADIQKMETLLKDMLSTEQNMSVEDIEILQLHGKLTLEEQTHSLSKRNNKKINIILATNIAETSLTIPDVDIVIDLGIVNNKKYNQNTHVSELILQEINKNSAKQRAGRAGRTKKGICYREYTENDYEKFRTESKAEIDNMNFDKIILQMIALGIKKPDSFDFIRKPNSTSLTNALQELLSMGAISKNTNTNEYDLTELGTSMSLFLSLEPVLSKMLVKTLWDETSSNEFKISIIMLCAILNQGGNFFFRNISEEAHTTKLRIYHESSDHISLLKLYLEWCHLPRSDQVTWCYNNGVCFKAFRTVHWITEEILKIIQKDFGMTLVNNLKMISTNLTMKIRKKIMQTYQKSIAIYTGRPQSGYICLQTHKIVFPHPTCSLNHLQEEFPRYIC